MSGLDFAEFLKRTKTRPATVARATGLHASTVTRIRDGAEPTGQTMMRIDRWAAGVANALELRPSERLSWDHLLDDRGAV